jgi:hypothetical protein
MCGVMRQTCHPVCSEASVSRYKRGTEKAYIEDTMMVGTIRRGIISNAMRDRSQAVGLRNIWVIARRTGKENGRPIIRPRAFA